MSKLHEAWQVSHLKNKYIRLSVHQDFIRSLFLQLIIPRLRLSLKLFGDWVERAVNAQINYALFYSFNDGTLSPPDKKERKKKKNVDDSSALNVKISIQYTNFNNIPAALFL